MLNSEHATAPGSPATSVLKTITMLTVPSARTEA